jgi:hypothetical protein
MVGKLRNHPKRKRSIHPFCTTGLGLDAFEAKG